MKEQRRSTLKKMFASIAAFTGIGVAAHAKSNAAVEKEVFNVVKDDQDVPLFSGSTRLGNLVFIAGKGAHFDGDITSHTKHVLDELEKELVKAGSSMQKVLKCSVFLHDLNDYKAMNEVFSKELSQLDESSKEVLERILDYMEKKYISVPMVVAKEVLMQKETEEIR